MDLYAKICKATKGKNTKIVKPNYTKDYPKTRQILKLKQCEILND